MKVYIAIDKETWTNIAVGTSRHNVLKEIWEQDVYFLSEEDFNKKFENRYTIQEWEVLTINDTI